MDDNVSLELLKAIQTLGMTLAKLEGTLRTPSKDGPVVTALLLDARESAHRAAASCGSLRHDGFGAERGCAPSIGEPLSPRQRDIVNLIADGNSNKEIARIVGSTPETVKTHLKTIFIRLSVETRAQAVFKAQSLGLVGPRFRSLLSAPSHGSELQ